VSRPLAVAALTALSACATVRPPAGRAALPPLPETRREGLVETLHGLQIPDPYRWLEDARSPEVQRWMAAQDARARAALARLPGRPALVARARELFYTEEMGVPVPRGGRLFYTRRAATAEKAVLAWRQGEAGEERVLLDPARWAADGSMALGDWSPSWDGRRVAYQVRRNNSDEATLRVVEVETGQVLEADDIAGGKYATASWTPTGDGFYYTWLPTDPAIPEPERPGRSEVRFHRLGTDPAGDRRVREATGDPTTFLHAQLSRDGRWLLLQVEHGWTSSDTWLRDLSEGEASPWRPVSVGRDAILRPLVHRGTIYARTNDGAPRWKVVAIDPSRPSPDRWRTVVPEADATLDDLSVVGGKLALALLQKATSRLELRELDGRLLRELPLPALGTASLPSGEEDGDRAYHSFESFTWPREIRAFSVSGPGSEAAPEIFFRPSLRADPSRYQVEQVVYPSRDGTEVTMFLVHGAGARPGGGAPVLLYGYGGFQISELPAFSPRVLLWLEQGGVYAVANLRGGGEYGEAWHRAGMLDRKQNVFDDFAAAGEWLLRTGWARPGGLAIYGGSNGGLLVGAAVTQRPELFRVALCAVPLLDMVRYHRFGAGRTWTEEYGSAEDPAQLRTLLAYSPYHHVVAGTRYPAVLLLSADADDRVDPMHARKFAAALQAATTGGPVLLRIERNAGHAGADLRGAEAEKAADMLGFALDGLRSAAPR
jgi:prolyl oligopeptidase